MRKFNGTDLFHLIIIFVAGNALYKKFNFETHTFDKPFLSAIYLLAFVGSISSLGYVLWQKFKEK